MPILVLAFLLCTGLCAPLQASQQVASKPAAKAAKLDALDKKIAQMLLIGFRGKSLRADDAFLGLVREGRVGSVILFDYDVPTKVYDRNIETPAQVKALNASLQEAAKKSGTKIFISIDQEGGRVNRLKPSYGFAPSVSQQYLGGLEATLGRKQALDSTRIYAAQTAQTLAQSGFNLNFAPLVDVNVNPTNPVIGGKERSFSTDPATVAAYAKVVVEEHRKRKIVSTLKHFPGHGSSKDDSHEGFVDVTTTWTHAELTPFATLIKQGAADMIMTAHIFNSTLDTVPATLSRRIITGILRDSLGYKGVVISDDMQMKAIAAHYGLETALERCINAGVDIVCFGNNLDYDPDIATKAHATIKKLVLEGKISPRRIDEAYKRVLALKKKIL
jgi:beta-N-acetylhexosaminidase